MFRIPAAALLLAICLATAACADNLLKERPVSRTARTAAVKPTFSAAGSAQGQSSVCAAYRRQLHQLQLRELMSSGKQQTDWLKAKELSLNAVIADACE